MMGFGAILGDAATPAPLGRMQQLAQAPLVPSIDPAETRGCETRGKTHVII